MSEEKTTMRVWDQVCTTKPSDTKKVNVRGGFTTIRAYSQIKKATEVFGPVGEGWGWDARFEVHELGEDIVLSCHISMWHGKRENTFCSVGSAFLRKSGKDGEKGKIDDDAYKKAMTDGITKGLSYLGFNADVFLGLWDDNKYVAEQRTKEAQSCAAKPSGPIQDPELVRRVGESYKGLGIDRAELAAWIKTNLNPGGFSALTDAQLAAMPAQLQTAFPVSRMDEPAPAPTNGTTQNLEPEADYEF